MTRRNPPARWVLPAIVNPPGRRCLSIEIPNERYHIAAFRGALLTLASALSWQDDMAHTAKEVALVWRDIVDNVMDCLECNFGIDTGDDEMQLRIKPGDECIIQTLCGDGTWMDWYDPRGCMPGSITQPGPIGQPDVGDCLEFDVALSGNGLYHLPVPVSGDDTIEISQVSGGWHDGDVGFWFCPDGQDYVLGTCVGGGGADAGDPLPTENHMRLIASIDGVYYDAYNTTITVPAGLSIQDMVFQANDAALADNSGSISFHVKYCHNESAPSGDCQESDFAIDAQSWATIAEPDSFGVYNAGNYWESEYIDLGGGNTYAQLRIYRAYVGHISSIKIVYSAAQDGYLSGSRDGSEPAAGPALFSVLVATGAMQTLEVPLNVTTTNHVRIDLSRDGDAANLLFKIHHIEICP